jgi:hypothetical protein
MSSLLAQNLGTFKPPTTAFSEGSADAETAYSNFESFISTLIGFLTVLGSIMFVIYFVVGAFEWITSGGDKGKLEKARSRMLYGTLGMILIIASYSLLGLFSSVIGIDFLNPAAQIRSLVQPLAN